MNNDLEKPEDRPEDKPELEVELGILISRIKKLPVDESISQLSLLIEKYPEKDEIYLARGLKHWAGGHRSEAIKDYLSALRINPESKAALALKAANDILDYYNKDLLNP